MLELLAPAGSMEALRAAVQNGADAVYLGCGMFNARQSAKNFTPQELTEAVKYCHVRGVAVHLTVNTLTSDREMPELCKLLQHAAACKVDAFIVQDLGVVQLCKQVAPGVALHGSTQMTVHSLPGVEFCAMLGMSRVVLSRELSREEIAYICANSPIEIEVFAHGALCMCYSGQCYLSAAIGARSGNRGRCAQPCRQSYGYGRWENRHPLSLKDNCLIDYLQDLEQMGVASVKLEGRMKRAEYVATVTGVYRKAMDEGSVTRPMKQSLMKAFNRQGFTDGYYTGKTGREMFGIHLDRPEDPAWLEEARRSFEAVENPLVAVHFAVRITEQESRLTVTDPQGRTCTAVGPVPEPARTQPLTRDRVAERISKTGGTPYRCADVQVELEPMLALSAAALNAMRRDALNRLTALRARREHTAVRKPQREPHYAGNRGLPGLTVQITGREQVTPLLLRRKPEVLYVPLHLLAQDPAWCRELAEKCTVAAVLPRIAHDDELAKLRQRLELVRGLGVTQALVGNIGLLRPALDAGMALRGDFGLNLFNSRAVNFAKELEMTSATLSQEMNLPQIRDVSKAVSCELIGYGRMSLMITENCIIRQRTGECSCHLGATRLLDKTGAEFPVIRDGDSCRSVLLNGKKLNLLDRREDLGRLGLWAVRLCFTTENPREVDQVLSSWQESVVFDPGSCTRGLYLRGVE